MARNHLIGIGGSGARAVEAAIHLIAAGLGPAEMAVSFIDADRGNGNLKRVRRLAKIYRDLHENLREAGHSHVGEECRLFKTDLVNKDDDEFWSPVPEGTDTMGHLFGRSVMKDGEGVLFDSLYHKHGEQDLDLTQGFRARPSIGAAVSLSRAVPSIPFWRNLLDAIKAAKQGETVRIFLVGSIFGGTGAAGFPVFARMLRHTLEQAKIDRSVHIAGALMLPYFSFPSPDADDRTRAPGAEIFLEQSQASLKYYYQLLQGTPLFDTLYVVGWPKLVPLDAFKPGGAAQQNPPLVPEMIAALAGLRFLQETGTSGAKLRYCGYSHEPESRFGWGDLPDLHDLTDSSVRESLGQTLRFAMAYDRIYSDYLEGKNAPINLPLAERQSWFRRLVLDAGVELLSTKNQNIVADLREYCRALQQWAATLCVRTATPELGVNLFRGEFFAETGVGLDSQGLLPLYEVLEQDHLDGFAELLSGTPASGLPEVFDALTYGRRPANASAFGIFHRALYDACAV